MTKSKYRLYSCLVNANKLLGQIYMAGLQIIHGCNLTNADLTWAGVYSNIARFHRRKVSSMVDDCLFTNRDFDMAQDFLYLFCFTITVKPDLSPDSGNAPVLVYLSQSQLHHLEGSFPSYIFVIPPVFRLNTFVISRLLFRKTSKYARSQIACQVFHRFSCQQSGRFLWSFNI